MRIHRCYHIVQSTRTYELAARRASRVRFSSHFCLLSASLSIDSTIFILKYSKKKLILLSSSVYLYAEKA